MAIHQIWVRAAAATLAIALCGAAGPQASAPVLSGAVIIAPIVPAADLRPDQTAAMLNVLAQATSQGFGPSEFRQGDAAALIQSQDPAEHGRGESLLRAAIVAYARAQHGGRIDGAVFPENWAVRPPPYDAEGDLNLALAQDRLAAWLDGLAPPFAGYRGLVAAHERYREIVAKGGWPIVPPGKPLKAGAVDPRVDILRQRLAVEDAAVQLVPIPAAAAASAAGQPPAPAPALVYDASLAEAVARAQDRFGLNVDGAAGASTIAALNIPAAERLKQIEANLERWRWMPRDLPRDRIEVNIAGADLTEYEAGLPVLTMRVIVGRLTDPTPMFQAQVTGVVFSPPWNVPASIAAKEIWPKERRKPGYMAHEKIVVQPDGSLQQKPGPKNALGLVKFDLPNPFSVYLHDTPSRSLFAHESRALSHGCMRLQQPYDLAKRLLQGDRNWPADRVDAALHGGVTVRAPLSQPVTVIALYWTAFVDSQGRMNFRPDVYGWDDEVMGLVAGPGALAANLTNPPEATCSRG